MFPKLIVFETSVLFTGSLREELWGKGCGASAKLADNVERVNDNTLKDKSNPQNTVTLSPNVPKIIQDALKNGAFIALVSSEDNKELVDRALYYFRALDPRDGEQKSIIKMVRYDEVVNEPKAKHFARIRSWSKLTYQDMVYFDNEHASDLSKEGIIVRPTERGGLTWDQYQQGIAVWRAEHDAEPVFPPKKTLKIAHFNDVYQVSEQKLQFNGKEEIIDVTKFATLLSNIKKGWESGDQGGLTIFSGDTFSPSYQSSITRGRHMSAVMNALGVEISVAGNHEFDFGYRRLVELIEATNFPWLLSNITDVNTNEVPVPMKAFHVIEKAGIRIGLIGLVEREWIATITGWPDNFKWEDMAVVGRKLSEVLRGSPHNCDVVFALTHSRIPNDIKLAEQLYALAPSAQKGSPIASEHGVDLLLGGHDHIYWISKGLGSWDGYDLNQALDDAAADKGDTLIVKSGTDFQDLSEISLTFKDTSPGSVRRKLIESISGTRHTTRGDLVADPGMRKVIDTELAEINTAMADPICVSKVELDASALIVRTRESIVGNWIADCLKPVYNDVLKKLGEQVVDCVIICMGDVRGNSTYAQGPITLGDLMQMLPYTDPMVVLEMDGDAIWTTIEHGLAKWPAQEGRFPAISGFRVEWQSSQLPGSRVQKMWLREETKDVGADGKPIIVDKAEIKREHGRKYLVAVGEWIANGGDDYTILKAQRRVLDGENGQSKSMLIRKFLLGAHFVNKVSRDPEAKPAGLLPETFSFVSKARTSSELPQLDVSIISTTMIPKTSAAPSDTPTSITPSVPKASTPPVNIPGPSVVGGPPKPRQPSSFGAGLWPAGSTVQGSSGSTFMGFPPRPQNSSLFNPWPSLSGAGLGSPAAMFLNHVGNTLEMTSRPIQRRLSDPGSRLLQSVADTTTRSAQDLSAHVQALQNATLDIADALQRAVVSTGLWIASTALQTFALRVSEHEDVNMVDGYERHRADVQIEGSFTVKITTRNRSATSEEPIQEKKHVKVEKDLPIISPAVDQRLKDLDRQAM